MDTKMADYLVESMDYMMVHQLVELMEHWMDNL